MDARFIAAYASADQLPPGDFAEVAVAGRSNCGKSSLINSLAGRSGLARTSKTPGRTRRLVLFSLRLAPAADPIHLVDLPGYGFARVSKSERAGWVRLVGEYVERREQLKMMLLLNDLRRPPEDEERDLLAWCRSRSIEVIVVLTKADKLAKNKRFSALEAARSALELEERPLLTSVKDPASIEALRRAIDAGLAGEGGQVSGELPTLIGLTGGIAAGKSSVARMLRELGAAVVDADEISREVVEPGQEALEAIRRRFGERVIGAEGRLDRAALGQLVFADASARRELEAITHPAIVAAARARFERLARAGHQRVVYEAALLVETGRHEELDLLVVVVADDQLRVRRLMSRSGLDEAEARRRLESQVPQRRKAELADYVIDNSGSIAETQEQVERTWKKILESKMS